MAVSGGPDSMALCLLADRWARVRGGAVVALTVDHDLRPGSAAEAGEVRRWLAARGIPCRILAWAGPKPASGIQAAAREVRYGLLTEACRGAGILHLLLAHHRDDQAETVAFRQERGSGPDGLAGMAAVREAQGVRLLRPLLPVAKADLIATLSALGQPWLEDPGNRASAFARGRLRRRELDVPGLTGLARTRGRCRAELDRASAAFLASAARIDPAGFVTIGRAALRDAPDPLARRVLVQALGAVSGRTYAPREARLAPLVGALRQGAGGTRTLGGCRILAGDERLLICREAGAIRDVVPLVPGCWRRWDDRFELCAEAAGAGLVVQALGERGWRERRRLEPQDDARDLPPAVGPGLPSIWRGERLLRVPHLGLAAPGEGAGLRVRLRYRPVRPLAGAPFAYREAVPR